MVADASAGQSMWRRLAGLACALAALVLLAACSQQPTQPFSKSGNAGLPSSRTPPPIAVTAMAGLPPDKVAVLSDALAEEGGLRDIAIVQGNFSDGYQLAGQFQAVPEGGGVRIMYQWTLTGNTGGLLHQITAQELAPWAGGDPWSAASPLVLKRIASMTAESLSSRLSELGFATRQSGVLPPLDHFAEAGPDAEKDIDLETYYGVGSPLATASLPPGTSLSEAAVGALAAQADPAAPDDPLATEQLAERGEAATEPAPVPIEPVRSADGKTEISAVAVTGVTGSPGRGNGDLSRAMGRALARAGWPVLDRPGPNALHISGIVTLGRPVGANQTVALAWEVKLPTGKVLGTVSQTNDVPAGSLDAGWGQTAAFAAEAAAEGIFEIVGKLRN